MKTLKLAALSLLCACQINSGDSEKIKAVKCVSSYLKCDNRAKFKEDGTLFFTCEASLEKIQKTITQLGFTYEVKNGWNRESNGIGAYTVAPSSAHFNLAKDSVNCRIGSTIGTIYHCTSEEMTTIVPSFELSEDVLNQFTQDDDIDQCLKIEVEND